MFRESDHFRQRRPDWARLEVYGFRKRDGGYRIEREFFDGFRAGIDVSREGVVTGRVVDRETGEEYLPLRSPEAVGPFVGKVRAAYGALLDEIAAACFTAVPFLSFQANRLQTALRERFGDAPDFPFARCPGYGVFRCPGNGKWYGLILTVPRGRLERGAEGDAARELMEIVNLKVAPESREKVLERDGVYPCYHMNRVHWVSVALDDRLSDEEILALLAASRAMVAGGAERPAGRARRTGEAVSWIVPANPRRYDVARGFRENGGRLDWTQTASVSPGDEVFLYFGAPVSSVLFRCAVLAVNLPDRERPGKRRMTIERRAVFPSGRFPLAWLRQGGVRSVRAARRLSEELARVMRAAAGEHDSGRAGAPDTNARGRQ